MEWLILFGIIAIVFLGLKPDKPAPKPKPKSIEQRLDEIEKLLKK